MAVSVDTKKKETLGKKAHVGKEYRPKGEPLEVDTHDFPDKELGKVIPYSVYDIKTKRNAFHGDVIEGARSRRQLVDAVLILKSRMFHRHRSGEARE